MSTQWDLLVYNRDSQITLAIEIKSKLDASPEWAAQFRRNILAHGNLPDAPYFLMAFPDRFYLWVKPSVSPEPILPSYTIDARSILLPYFEQSGVTPDQVSGTSLELIIISWLSDVMHRQPQELKVSQPWLIDSGLYAALVGGRLAQRVAA